jgi:carbamoyltransferase
MIITDKNLAVEQILNQQIVAIFQNSSEYGPRGLGNRSLLFDPRNKNGKDIVNKIKKREWFRPFAGTVLLEHARDWFDMGTIKESPYMSYAIPVKEEKKSLIPAITHVDGTCRVQTVTKEQNKIFYEIIKLFYERTNVPILFNTSFNLAGDPLVETKQDAINTLNNSDINYLYMP